MILRLIAKCLPKCLVAGVDERRGALNQWGTYYKKLWSEGLRIFKGVLNPVVGQQQSVHLGL